MGFWQGFVILSLIHLLAAASPGPDFALVTRQSLVHGRRAGMLTSLGVALGLAVHVMYSAAGLAVIIARSPLLTEGIKLCGAGILFFLGYSALQSSTASDRAVDGPPSSRAGFVASGFVCNLFNPKAPLYFLALFTAVLPVDLPKMTLAIYGAWIVILQWLWFALVATVFTHARIRTALMSSRKWIERVFGVAMIAIALRLLLSLF